MGVLLMAIRLYPIKPIHTRRSQYARWILKKSRLVIVFVLIPKLLAMFLLQVLLLHTPLIVSTMKLNTAAPLQIGAIAKFTLNEIVSVELGETGNTTKVDNSASRAIYNDQRGTTENKECSGRGLCDETS